jgi:hypothetical protein
MALKFRSRPTRVSLLQILTLIKKSQDRNKLMLTFLLMNSRREILMLIPAPVGLT